jgi:hypothetical protein
MKERWIWVCGYDKGSGVDREVCCAKSRKPVSSKKEAEKKLQQHLSKCNCRAFGCYSGNNGYVYKIEKYKRFK